MSSWGTINVEDVPIIPGRSTEGAPAQCLRLCYQRMADRSAEFQYKCLVQKGTNRRSIETWINFRPYEAALCGASVA